MGCLFSFCNKQQAGINSSSYIEIPLLQTAKTPDTANPTQYYTSMEPPQKKPTYEGNIIEHSKFQVKTNRVEEESRKQTFKECFSHIDVNTFQNVPFMSVQSHLSVPQFDSYQQSLQSHKFEEYSQFLDRIVPSILGPLHNMKVQDETDLTLLLDQ